MYLYIAMNFRPERVGNLIRDELSKLVQREVELPQMLATIMEVEVDKKLEHAKVGVSVIPSESADSALRILNQAKRELQFLLGRKLNIKPMPEIMFYIDHGSENAARIEKVLIEEERKNGIEKEAEDA